MTDSTTFEGAIKKTFFDFWPRPLSINPSMIRYGNKEMTPGEINALRYGITQLYVHGIRANRFYEFHFLSRTGQKLRITFSSSGVFKINQTIESLYLNLVNVFWNCVTKRIVNDFLEELKRGKSVPIGPCELTSKGLLLTYRHWFKKTTQFVPWNDALMDVKEGNLYLFSKSNKKAKVAIALAKTWNAVVLHALLEYLWEGGRAYLLAENRL